MVGGSDGFERMLKVTVLEINAGRVRLGFEVDAAVPVHCWEVWERIHAAGKENGLKEGLVVPVTPGTGKNGHSGSMKLPAVAVAAPRKYGILVVDDEASVRRALNAGMLQQGFAVWLAADGQEALDLYQRYRASIDVVLMDVCMPGVDGPRALAALREINPEIRCFFMSGDVGSYAEWKLGNLGAVSIIRKPFQLAEVVQTLWELACNGDGFAIP